MEEEEAGVEGKEEEANKKQHRREGGEMKSRRQYVHNTFTTYSGSKQSEEQQADRFHDKKREDETGS